MSVSKLHAGLAALIVLSVASLSGCASARMSDQVPDQDFRAHRYEDAANRLKADYTKEGGENSRDSLLFILDIGLALHSAGDLDESTKYFLKANDLAVIKDYTSISKETATLVTSDNIKDYKAEDFENVLINTYLAMNYALQGNFEDALVEARRTNQKLYMMVSQGGRKYKQNAFTRYLSAILYETDNDFNDAYVDYKNVHDLVPGYPGLGRDLWRCAYLEGIDDDLAKWDQEYKLTEADHQAAMSVAPKGGKGEIIVMYENGISPIKKPNPQFKEVPKFYPRANSASYADVEINGVILSPTHMLHNIEATAIENLDEKWGGMVAKKVAGVVVTEGIGYGVGRATKSPLLGALTAAALGATNTADVRSWELLPHDLQMARIPLDPGTYTIRIIPRNGAAAPAKTITVQQGKRSFANFRFMP